ncbi:PTS mannose transporter subunit EIIAB [Oenococcus oeni]|uniref:PTS sugar transporter subunit IIB n=1 Tax=Oenococcus oeni TaxID=1247 RepID=UPI000277B193|nr:PTS sugar transporter subunit IIB [Oenococcus oeni]EJO02024.1 phosphotransferase system, mannose/fructose-specific component IIA [Oenococcus oeni AWRIB318]EKP89230.1 phosphotransferase system, mannose/fructose-specific component IIA [Oenococcus oeni AWRIB202]OIK65764.1 PTS mannose transporter subunit EIIAB [Oenococcus oeni]OIK74976.1 PTS mannose transporter subunit EIIAB [Oenococcus oeni]OIK77433.1 PTS mannose transporter subunit EIIAB [Oenococcus oeni]
MVGIVLASHGNFAEGIYQSAEMIFGKQQNVQTVTLSPNEGPEDFLNKLKQAIDSFDDQKQVLLLIDLWGGTPFNQSSGLLYGHEDSWAVVTGMNLPMVIEAYGSRSSMDSAQEIATHIIETGKDGIRIKPESLEPKKATATVKSSGQAHGTIAPGTVLGDGKIKYVLARVDSRLLHGQVAMSWTKATNPNRILVVSDSVAKDRLRKSMIVEAAPPGVNTNVIPIKKMIEVAKDPRFGNTKALVLFENPEDALKTIEGGVDIKELNIGSMSHAVGKVAVNKVLSLGKEDVEAFDGLKKLGVKFDVRKVPGDSSENMDNIVNKARKDLSSVKS